MSKYICIPEINRDLYIKFSYQKDDVYITSPSDDNYNFLSPRSKINNYIIKFFYLDCVYSVHTFNLNCLKTYKKNDSKEKYNIYFITKKQYLCQCVKQDRFKLLIDSNIYRSSNKKIPYQYNIDSIYCNKIYDRLPVIKEILLNNNTDFDKMTKIMFLIHHIYKHRGQLQNPIKRDCLSIMKFAEKNNNSLNCRCLAILLCEILLSMGMKAHYIICSQSEIKYLDSHVVTVCYDRNMRKWIMLDPCYNLYVKDINDVPISLEELKTSIINSKFIKANNEACHQGAKLDFKSYIKANIKKLYKFETVINTYFGMDNNLSKNNIVLVPNETNYSELNCTSNNKVFWNFGVENEKN